MTEHEAYGQAFEHGRQVGYEEGKKDAVKHGRWEQMGESDYKCSVCGFRFTSSDPIAMFPYCRCGARMDRVEGA